MYGFAIFFRGWDGKIERRGSGWARGYGVFKIMFIESIESTPCVRYLGAWV